jgi:signal transduction histidine kinase
MPSTTKMEDPMTSDVTGWGEQKAWHVTPAHQHLVQFYESEDYLLFMLSQFVATTMRNGEAGVVVATEPHVKRLRSQLAQDGIDVHRTSMSGQLTMLDASVTMEKFMVDGKPDEKRFNKLFGGLIDDIRSRWPSVRIFGEMVALTAEVNYETVTVDLEELWNGLLAGRDFSLCCAYPLETFDNANMAGMLHDICEQHTAVFPTERYANLKTDEERFREITLLQQKATQLEHEVRQRANAQEKLKKALESERTARQEAEAALRLRDEFVTIAAHELKTPLTSLVGRAQLAVKRLQATENVEPKQIEKLMSSVVTQSEKLSRLISQLLDVSRLKGGKLSIDRQMVDLVTLLNDSVYSVHVGHNSHTVTVSAPETLIADVDPIRIEQVIVNLLNNAVKFSPPESEVSITLNWPNNDTIELAVQDQGPGIPVTERERIFDRFYQGNRQGLSGGMGLGLYVCREITQLHGGDVLAEFPESGGTRFVVRLPISPHAPVRELI